MTAKALAPVAKVWSTYASLADIVQWNASSADWHTTKSIVDLRESGDFSSRMEAKDGSFGFYFAGTYTQLVPNQRIGYTFGHRTGTVEFIEGADGVTVRSTLDAKSTDPVEQQRFGWQSIQNKFSQHVEASQ